MLTEEILGALLKSEPGKLRNFRFVIANQFLTAVTAYDPALFTVSSTRMFCPLR